MATIIPHDAKDKALFLYHPSIPGSKRIDITERNPNASNQISQLKREGWTEKRFAKTLFHRKHGAKMITDPKQLESLLAAGWMERPITDLAQAKGAHRDAVHPHISDEMRLIHLSNDEEMAQVSTDTADADLIHQFVSDNAPQKRKRLSLEERQAAMKADN